MSFEHLRDIYKAELSDAQFDRLGTLIMRETGIKMPPIKKVMVQARLKKRLRVLDMSSFDDYVNFVFSPEGQVSEVIHIFDAVSTNKTDFFREPVHFDFLKGQVLPEFLEKSNGGLLKVWSAACSSGEEPYTLGITINEFVRQHGGFDFMVHGTDISTLILKMANNGIFTHERVSPAVPDELLRRYFMRSKDDTKKTYRIVPELRQKMRFSRLNFMDDSYNLPEKYDVVFCRNVLIYFDRPTQEAVVSKICNYLKPGGYFFHGHSESLIGMNLPLKNVRPTVFRRI
ncbi:CheR family methyltransferase [Alkaliflexus imshenetskii]|uniref:CheR family methyltransferase n=1 Tax=Alkaliflexus imshenetskii TaxID=286730 RepID=UPI000479F81F|nr:CheR family methyltransferase [Alkaliflexus imshenetskii]